MKSLSWITRTALAPLIRRPGHFFIYVLIFYLLGFSLLLFHNFQASLNLAQAQSSAELLGGDVEVDIGYRAFQPVETRYLEEYSQAQSELVSFRTMVQFDQNNAPLLRLSNLRAIDTSYPLFGQVTLSQDAPEKDLQKALSLQNQLYGILFSNELTQYFGAKPGDIIRILDQDFRFAGTIEATPELAGNQNIFLPSATISKNALQKLDISSDTMLISYKRFLQINPETNADEFRQAALLDFHDKGWQITTAQAFSNDQSEYFSMAVRVAGFINFIVLIALGVALFTILRTQMVEEIATSQTLLAMGGTPVQILLIYGFRLLALLLIAMSFALLSVWGLSHIQLDLSPQIAQILNPPSSVFWQAALRASIILALISFFSGLVTFGTYIQAQSPWPPIIASAGFILLILYLIPSYQFDDASFAVLASFAISILMFWIIIVTFKWLIRHSVSPRSISRISLLEYSGKSSSQENFGALIFANLLVISCFSIILLAVHNQAEDFREAQKPSHFVADLQNDQVDNFETLLEQSGAREISLYPIVRARVTGLNGQPPQEEHWLFEGDRFLGSDEGHDLDLAVLDHENFEIGLDENLAKELQIQIGDQLTLSVLGIEKYATVKTLRTVERDLQQLDFIILIPAKAMEDLPNIYLSSLALTKEQLPVIKTIADRFPNAVIVSSDRALLRLQGWLDDLTRALAILGIHILSATLVALFCVGALIMRKERYDQTVFAMMGMRKRDLRRLQLNKVLLNTLLAGLATFLLCVLFIEYAIEPVIGLPLRIQYGNLGLIILIAALICSSVPAIFMLFGAANPKRADEFAQDYHKVTLDF